MKSEVAERGLRDRNDRDKKRLPGLRFSRRSSIMQRGKAARSACRSPVSRLLRYIIPEECSRNNKRTEKKERAWNLRVYLGEMFGECNRRRTQSRESIAWTFSRSESSRRIHEIAIAFVIDPGDPWHR